MTLSRRRAVALRRFTSFASFAAFAAVVVGGLSLLGPVRPAHADDQSRAVAACRTSVATQVDGIDARSLGIDRIGGGGRRYKVWLATGATAGEEARRFYCVANRGGTVEEVTALNADGTPGQAVVAAR